MKQNMITIIGGLPRSGTSLMMQIVEAAGLDIYSDNVRTPDVSNPKGYSEHQKVKGMMKDNSFLQDAENKAIKIVSPLIPFINPSLNYRAIILKRNIDEILDSQQTMLGKEKGNVPPALKAAFEKQYSNAITFLEKNNIEYIEIEHKQLVAKNKEEFQKITDFLKSKIGTSHLIDCIDEKLYRQRK